MNTTTRNAKSLRDYARTDLPGFRKMHKKRANRMERQQGKKLCRI